MDDSNGDPNGFKSRLLLIFYASVSVVFSLFLSGLAIYCKNSGEFTFRFSSLFFVTFAGAVILTFLLALPQLLLWKWKYFPVLNALILALGYVIWLQNTYLAGMFPEFTPPFSEWEFPIFLFGSINLVIFALPFLLAVLFHRWCSSHCGKLCAIILIAQLIPMFFLLLKYTPPKYDFYEYSVQEKDKFQFAAHENVVIVVVDCMSEFLFKNVLKKASEIGELFQDFTCFDGIVSGTIPQTVYAVPALLTGVEYSNQENTPWKGDHGEYLKLAFHSEKSLFRAFKKAGFRCEAYPYVLQTVSYNSELIDNVVSRTDNSRSIHMFFDVFLFKQTPYFAKSLLADSSLSLTDLFVNPADEITVSGRDVPYDIAFYKRLSSEMKLGSFEKGLKYFHLQGAHGPLKVNENLEPALDTNAERQLRGSMRNLELLLKNMKTLGIYEDALILITGDHTERYTPEMITLVKRPGEKHSVMSFNSIPCRLSDLSTAVLSEKKLMNNADTLFSRPVVKGSGSIRSDALPEILFSVNWRSVGHCAVPEKINLYMNAPTYLERDVFTTSRSDFDSRMLVSIQFRAVELTTGQGWETVPASPVKKTRSPDLYQTSLKGLPDGEYALFIIEELSNNSPENSDLSTLPVQDRQETAIPQFYLVRNGGFERLKTSPREVPRPMFPGEKIVFHPFSLYPSLTFSENCLLGKNSLVMKDTGIVSVLLPPEPSPLFLNLSLDCVVQNKSVFQVYDGEKLIHSTQVDPSLKIEAKFQIPELSRKKNKLDLHFKIATRVKSHERKSTPVFHLTGIELKKSL